MKTKLYIVAIFAGALLLAKSGYAQSDPAAKTPVSTAEADAKSKEDTEKKAAEWAASLTLNDAAKEARVKQVIATHMLAVRDWNNSHSADNVPAGINPTTGKPLTVMERQIIINSTIPKSVHTDLMTGLHKDLTDDQVELILDKYTQGKVAFTLAGYKSIVPVVTPEDEKVILTNLKLAREQAIDYKNIKQVSAIFEIHKTVIENYFTNSGRNWHQMYKVYTDAVKAKKAADAAVAPPKN